MVAVVVVAVVVGSPLALSTLYPLGRTDGLRMKSILKNFGRLGPKKRWFYCERR